jgi:hypothetical protein
MTPKYEDILDCMRVDGWIKPISGRDLRERLSDKGFKMSGPVFYFVMAKFEDDHQIISWDEPKEIDGITVKVRWYARA